MNPIPSENYLMTLSERRLVSSLLLSAVGAAQTYLKIPATTEKGVKPFSGSNALIRCQRRQQFVISDNVRHDIPQLISFLAGKIVTRKNITCAYLASMLGINDCYFKNLALLVEKRYLEWDKLIGRLELEQARSVAFPINHISLQPCKPSML